MFAASMHIRYRLLCRHAHEEPQVQSIVVADCKAAGSCDAHGSPATVNALVLESMNFPMFVCWCCITFQSIAPLAPAYTGEIVMWVLSVEPAILYSCWLVASTKTSWYAPVPPP